MNTDLESMQCFRSCVSEFGRRGSSGGCLGCADSDPGHPMNGAQKIQFPESPVPVFLSLSLTFSVVSVISVVKSIRIFIS